MIATTSLFQAPPAPEEKQQTLRMSDSGQDAMRKLRHPFEIAAGSAPSRTK